MSKEVILLGTSLGSMLLAQHLPWYWYMVSLPEICMGNLEKDKNTTYYVWIEGIADNT